MRVPFDPPPGLVSDQTTYSAQGLWETGNNVRFYKDKPESIGGPEKIVVDTLEGVSRNILPFTENDGNFVVAFGTHSSLEILWGGVLYDITPVGLADGNVDSAGDAPGYGVGTYGTGTYSTPQSIFYCRTWSLDTWGENLVASPRGGTLYLWQNNPASVATVVTNAPDEITAMLVTPERQVLALGCNEEVSGTFNPLCIRGCDIADLTDWTTNSDDNVFEHILEGGGRIVTGRVVGPFVAVWTDNNLHLGRFQGNPGQAYRFDLVASNCGLIGPNAVVVVGATAYWVGMDRQVRVWTPGVEPKIIECPVWNDFTDNLDLQQTDKIVASSISKFDEVWFHYPDTRDGDENSRYIAMSLSKGTWFKGEMARTGFTDAGVAAYPVAAAEDGSIYYHEKSTDVDWSIKSADQYINEAQVVAQIQSCIPDFEEQAGNISLTLYVRQYPQDTAITKGPYTLSDSGRRTHFRASGKIVAFEWEGSGRMRFGKPSFDAVAKGRR